MKPTDERSSQSYVLSATIRDYTCVPRTTCPSCDGGKRCTQCSGTGKNTCSKCGGRGRRECPTCEGYGDCPHCKGNGYFRCSRCDGSGLVPNGPNDVQTCYHCHGEGVVKCDFCNGERHCPTCKGRREITCSKCRGEGTQTCTGCRGSGQCVTCSGIGSLICERCQGTGNYQTYTAFQAKSYSKYKSIRPSLIALTDTDRVGSQVLYSGTTCEWANGERMQFNKDQQVQADCLKKMNSDEQEQFIKQLDTLNELKHSTLAPDSSADRPWQTNLEVKRIPVTTVRFTVEGKSYAVRFIGQGTSMEASTTTPLPTAIKALQMSSEHERHMRNSSPKKRAKAFILLGRYISENIYHDKDWESKNDLLRHLTNMCCSSQSDREDLNSYVFMKLLSNSTKIMEEIRPLLHSKKTLAFIWQCIAVDHQPNEEAMALLRSVANAMQLTEQDINATKSMAIGFAKLPGAEAVKEYVEPEKDTRAGRVALWIMFLLLVGLILGIVYGAKGIARYYHNDYLPKKALTSDGPCNRLAQEAIDKNDFEKAHYYLTNYCYNRTKKGKNARKIAETAVHFVDKALNTAYAGEPAANPLVPLAVDVYLAFNQSTHKTCQEECDHMRLALVLHFLELEDLLSANKVMIYADVESQIYFTDKALAYCIKAGDKKLANRYFKASMEYVHSALYNADVSPFERRWKKIMRETKAPKDFRADPQVMDLIRKKIMKNGGLLRWVD